MFKSLAVVALCFGTAAAFCSFCNITSQDEAIQKAQVLAKVLVKSNAQQQNGQNQYDAEFQEVFKPQGQNGSNSFQRLSSSSDLSCSGFALVQGQTYLIAGKQNGNNVEFEKCSGIPLTAQGIPNGAILWSAVPQELQNKLKNAGQQGGQQQQQGGQQQQQQGGQQQGQQQQGQQQGGQQGGQQQGGQQGGDQQQPQQRRP